MENLTFDSGVKSYRIGAGVLTFNPSDPNLYARFLEALDTFQAVEKELSAVPAGEAIATLKQTDGKLKAILSGVFGPGNDMEAIFGGVSLLAVGANGERLITNFLAAIEPILSQGARACAAAEAAKL